MRLVTHADVDDAQGGSPFRGAPVDEVEQSQPAEHAVPGIAPPSGLADNGLHVKARHELELDDGRRILLLNDRGWSLSGPSPLVVTADEADLTTRAVVGPDGAYGDRTDEDMARDHWESLARDAADQGVEITADRLRQLPHDVILSPRLRKVVDAVG